eukprot:GHVR01008143.1.p1 GENE.GHVR01008143.1~~GHVR01008143.1.p1  ORF type:complete len:465 (+),score=146.81 GHVR01008143.1:73-1467(+)
MGNSPVQIVRPVTQVQGRAALKHHQRPPCLGGFFDAAQGSNSGIIVVTDKSIENFSSKTGIRVYNNDLRVFSGLIKQESSIRILCCTCNLSSSLGSCIITACSDSTIKVFHSRTLIQLRSIELDPSDAFPCCIFCPLNNAVVCGFVDGSVSSYFLENSQKACTYRPPNVNMPGIATALRSAASHPQGSAASHSDGNNNENNNNSNNNNNNNEENTDQPLPVSCISYYPPLPVSCISYYQPKGSLLVGHATHDPQVGSPIGVEGICVYVYMYSLETARCLYSFEGARESIRAVSVIHGGTVVCAVSARSIYFWGVPSLTLLSVTSFAELVPTLDTQGRCVSSVIDVHMSPPVTFSAFDDGRFASFLLNVSLKEQGDTHTHAQSHTHTQAHTHAQVKVSPIKLYQFRANNNDEEYSPAHLLQHIWLDTRTETIVLGDGASRVRLVPDIYGLQRQRQLHLAERNTHT